MRIEKRYMTKEQMRKSDYYILKTNHQEHDSGDTSSSLLDLDNNEFNFSSINKVRCSDIIKKGNNGKEEVVKEDQQYPLTATY